jgi:hypothetical protein
MARGRKKGGTDRWAAARAARAAKRAAQNGESATLREFAVMFREKGSEIHLEQATPLKFSSAEGAAEFAGILKQRFPRYEYFVTT